MLLPDLSTFQFIIFRVFATRQEISLASSDKKPVRILVFLSGKVSEIWFAQVNGFV